MILFYFVIKTIKALPSLWDGYECEWTGACAHRYNTKIHATQSKTLLPSRRISNVNGCLRSGKLRQWKGQGRPSRSWFSESVREMQSRSALGKSLLSTKSLRTNINLLAGPQSKPKFYNHGRWFMAWWGARVILPVEGFLASFQSSNDNRGTRERIHLEGCRCYNKLQKKNTASLLRHCLL